MKRIRSDENTVSPSRTTDWHDDDLADAGDASLAQFREWLETSSEDKPKRVRLDMILSCVSSAPIFIHLSDEILDLTLEIKEKVHRLQIESDRFARLISGIVARYRAAKQSTPAAIPDGTEEDNLPDQQMHDRRGSPQPEDCRFDTDTRHTGRWISQGGDSGTVGMLQADGEEVSTGKDHEERSSEVNVGGEVAAVLPRSGSGAGDKRKRETSVIESGQVQDDAMEPKHGQAADGDVREQRGHEKDELRIVQRIGNKKSEIQSAKVHYLTKFVKNESGRLEQVIEPQKVEPYPEPPPWHDLETIETFVYEQITYKRGDVVEILMGKRKLDYARIRDIRRLPEGMGPELRIQIQVQWFSKIGGKGAKRPEIAAEGFSWPDEKQYILTNHTDVLMGDVINDNPFTEEDRPELFSQIWILDILHIPNQRIVPSRHQDVVEYTFAC